MSDQAQNLAAIPFEHYIKPINCKFNHKTLSLT